MINKIFILIGFIVGIHCISIAQEDKKELDSIDKVLEYQKKKEIDSLLKNMNYGDYDFFVYFPGAKNLTESDVKLNDFLKTNIHYPDSANLLNLSAKIYVSFVITETGKITDVKIEKGSNPYFDSEVLRVMALMPDWEWDKKVRHRVKTKRTLPFVFKQPK